MFIVLAGLGVTAGMWKLSLVRFPGWVPILGAPSAAVEALMEAPVDPAGSKAVAEAFKSSGIGGVSVAVITLSSQAENSQPANAAIIVLDSSAGFKPPSGAGNKRKQALNTIKRLVDDNAKLNLNLKQVALEYREEGKAVLGFAVPMQAMTDFSAGRLTEEKFLAEVNVKIQDRQFVLDLVNSFR